MTTYIQRAISDVTAEPDSSPVESADRRWEEQERLEKIRKRQQRNYLRTQAEGFDD